MHFPRSVQKHSSSFRWARKRLHRAFKLCDIETEKRNFLLVNQGFFFILHLILSGAVLVIVRFSGTAGTQ